MDISPAQGPDSCVLALHCSLGSGRQWARLAEALDGRYQVVAPDLAGYRQPINPATTLAREVDCLSETIAATRGPIHLIGHSYGGAVAFKIATTPAFASRLRSLTLIEPVLPTLLRDNDADRRLHDRFRGLAIDLCIDFWNGNVMEAVDKFVCFWNGSEPVERPSPEARLRMIAQAEQLTFHFRAILAEDNVVPAAATIRVPTLLMSGGLSPYVGQRTVQRLAGLIAGSDARHFRDAGHMMPLTHRHLVNAEIIKHIAHADGLAAGVPVAASPLRPASTATA